MLRQGAGQDGALQGLGDGVLTGEGVGGGQPGGQAAAKLLDHRDVRLGEAGPLGVAGQGEDPNRALVYQQRGGQDAVGPQPDQQLGQVRGEVVPPRQLRLRVAQELAGPGGVGQLDRHRANGGDLVLPEFGQHRDTGRVAVRERGGVQGAVRRPAGTPRSGRPGPGTTRWAACSSICCRSSVAATISPAWSRNVSRSRARSASALVARSLTSSSARSRSARCRAVRSTMKVTQRKGSGSITAAPIRTGTRCPSRCTYSFSSAGTTPVRRSCATAAASPLAYSGGSDRLIGQAPGLQVVAAVADEVEEGVVGVVDPLLAADDHAERVGLPQPAEQSGALPQGRLHPALLGQVGEHRVGALRPALLVAGLGHRGDPQPADLIRLAVRHPEHHVTDHLAGAQRLAHRQLLGGHRGAVLVHGAPERVQRPGDLGLGEPEDLPRRRVYPEHGPVGGVVDDTLRHGLEHAAELLLGRGEPGRGCL